MQSRTVELQPAWVLHTRPYRESSLLVDLLTQSHGRIAVVVNGARGTAAKNGRPRRGRLLQPFAELLVSWSGKSELKTLKSLEQCRVLSLSGTRLFSGLYVNELLQRLLQPWEPVDGVTALYVWLLENLAADTHLERSLRLFEKRLLDALGYGLPLSFTAGSGDPMNLDGWYCYDPANGFWPLPEIEATGTVFPGTVFSGAMLQALADEVIEDSDLLPAKALMRQAFKPLLGERPLRSRELFRIA